MYGELRGAVPKLPIDYARTLINRAWRQVRESALWSFNILEFSWISPPQVTTGTANITQGATTGTFDASAIAALNASVTLYSPITSRQFRVAFGGIYNIIQYNSVTGAFTLDRPFGDQGGAAITFQIYQVYYTPPVKDFLALFSVRNPQMFMTLDLSKTRAWLDATDPQRTWYQFPSKVIKFGTDQRGAGTSTPSATLGYPLYELWGQPLQLFTYQVYGCRKGADLSAATDTLPPAVGEDLVLSRAKAYAYEWAEANKDMVPRASGPDFRFLIGQSLDVYQKLLVQYRRQDRELVNNYLRLAQMNERQAVGIYNTLASVAAPYFPG